MRPRLSSSFGLGLEPPFFVLMVEQLVQEALDSRVVPGAQAQVGEQVQHVR